MSYGSRDNFLATYNPDVQRFLCADPDVCFFGGAPTLSEINAAYGMQTAVMWLIPQLYNLSEYCGCKDKLEGNPLKECATVIATDFYFLSVSEIMLFFHRFKSGRYGRFYGSIDPLVITTSIRVFLNERIAAYDEHERAEKERREKEIPTMSWEEYSMKKYGEVRPMPFQSRSKKKKVEPVKPSEEFSESLLKVAQAIEYDEAADKHTKTVFIEKFKKHHGITPKEYIKKYGDRQDSEPRHTGGNEADRGGVKLI